MLGSLYIVATPIGNLDDVTKRAINTLCEVDIILAEDTRVTKKLLDNIASEHYAIKAKLISYHQHSSEVKKQEIARLLLHGMNIALVTDAGTPGISDPGNELIDYLYLQVPGIKIVPIPGPSSITTALSACGFKAGSFEFIGYFPKKGSSKIVELIKTSDKTMVFFDSPFRITKTVDKLIEGLGEDHLVFMAQEMTKVNERYFRGCLLELKKTLEEEKKNLGRVKGEIVVVI